MLPHLEWDGTATGEDGIESASDKSAPDPAPAAAGDLIAPRWMGVMRGNWETEAGGVEYSSRKAEAKLTEGSCTEQLDLQPMGNMGMGRDFPQPSILFLCFFFPSELELPPEKKKINPSHKYANYPHFRNNLRCKFSVPSVYIYIHFYFLKKSTS